MLCALAHELRHVWQCNTDNDGFFKDYKGLFEVGDSYSLQKAEIDAVAYSILYMESLGHDGMHQIFGSNYEDAYAHPEKNSMFLMQVNLVKTHLAYLKNAAA